uniref:Uncharacterized protein n=1 Tax=Oncorhynchus tshawytscha TaxID=74940 RepID=A0AAZ3SKS0_ONCTS
MFLCVFSCSYVYVLMFLCVCSHVPVCMFSCSCVCVPMFLCVFSHVPVCVFPCSCVCVPMFLCVCFCECMPPVCVCSGVCMSKSHIYSCVSVYCIFPHSQSWCDISKLDTSVHYLSPLSLMKMDQAGLCGGHTTWHHANHTHMQLVPHRDWREEERERERKRERERGRERERKSEREGVVSTIIMLSESMVGAS